MKYIKILKWLRIANKYVLISNKDVLQRESNLILELMVRHWGYVYKSYIIERLLIFKMIS